MSNFAKRHRLTKQDFQEIVDNSRDSEFSVIRSLLRPYNVKFPKAQTMGLVSINNFNLYSSLNVYYPVPQSYGMKMNIIVVSIF